MPPNKPPQKVHACRFSIPLFVCFYFCLPICKQICRGNNSDKTGASEQEPPSYFCLSVYFSPLKSPLDPASIKPARRRKPRKLSQAARPCVSTFLCSASMRASNPITSLSRLLGPASALSFPRCLLFLFFFFSFLFLLLVLFFRPSRLCAPTPFLLSAHHLIFSLPAHFSTRGTVHILQEVGRLYGPQLQLAFFHFLTVPSSLLCICCVFHFLIAVDCAYFLLMLQRSTFGSLICVQLQAV